MNPTILKAILKFFIAKKLFKYFQQKYNKKQMKEFNNVIKNRGKIKHIQLSSKYLKNALINE